MALTPYSIPNVRTDWRNIGAGISSAAQGVSNIYRAKAAKEHAFNRSVAVDPVQLMNDKLMEDQSALINDYQQKMRDLYKKRKGRLSTEDIIQRDKDKQDILMWQQKQQNDLKNYQTVQQAMVKDTKGDFDHQNFERLGAAWLAGEDVDMSLENLMQPSPVNPIDFALKYKPEKKYSVKTHVLPDGKEVKVSSAMTPEIREDAFESLVAFNPRFMRGVTNMFNNLPPEQQQFWYAQKDAKDTANADKIANGEMNPYNVYMMWGKKNIAPLIQQDEVIEDYSAGAINQKTARTGKRSIDGKSNYTVVDNAPNVFERSGQAVKINNAKAMQVPVNVVSIPKTSEGYGKMNPQLANMLGIPGKGEIDFKELISEGADKNDRTNFIPVQLTGDMVEGIIRLPARAVKEKATPTTRGARPDPETGEYFVMKKIPARSETVTIRYDDIKDDLEAIYPGFSENIVKEGYTFSPVDSNAYPIIDSTEEEKEDNDPLNLF